MTHYNESAEYWGDRAEKVMGAGSGRLTARSVKIFADGTPAVIAFEAINRPL